MLLCDPALRSPEPVEGAKQSRYEPTPPKQSRLSGLRRPEARVLLALAVLAILAVHPVHAATVYWDLNGSTEGAGSATPDGTWDAATENWNDTADGTGTVSAWSDSTPGNTAVFAAGTNATGTYTVTVDGTRDIGGLTFQEGTVTISGGTALRLTSDATVDVASGRTATVAADVWIRPEASVFGTRCTRCPPPS